ncbi:MAG: AAA family ATPase [Clostridium sp.]|nr:AAA family ATPase [Clostridium sp.]
MNIGQAKQDIKDTVRLYLKKDEFGEYRIPVVRQRPIFLIGAPGIGKTAIMEQIAQELQIALVSYSMTHHTRQSALGLPVICHREYEGKEYDVSEYTMSEIIASVYEVMRESGLKEGILFLDEINCVSETLAPSMLQFLQYKVFGGHRVPEGWVIVTAGNPKEYNRSVREFDVVTLDRLKVLCVEADYEAWKRYAEQGGLHRAVLNYLELKKQDFYVMEMTAKGRAYVTARGWEDLSQMLFLYEEESLPVTEELVGQYLGHERVVREFMAYYDLYCKYQKDYHIGEILRGNASEEMRTKAAGAPFDERISLLGMLTDSMDGMLRECMEKTDYLENLMQILKNVKRQMGVTSETGRGGISADEALSVQITARERLLDSLSAANALSPADQRMHKRVLAFLREQKRSLLLAGEQILSGSADANSAEGQFAAIRQAFARETASAQKETAQAKQCLHHLFSFVEQVFADGNELLLLVTHMTATDCCAGFVARFGCEDYERHSGELMLSERRGALLQEMENLEL